MGITKLITAFAALFTVATAIPAVAADLSSTATVACTTGEPVVTAGYTINYAQASPTVVAADAGYQPDPVWGSQHVAATYTYGVPEPKETGFAYAQFKCQYTCNAAPGGSSFFVQYVGGQTGSFCTCYNDLLKPESFVPLNQTIVGGWNAICGVTHPSIGRN
ncbi:hypothetical protein SCAR479_07711 [Seiridium cardinale]|uniref:Secreted protein n=1 Tax=Seiridium cardinale TaxID=138064 RepID=A0ABR2XP70_9PEZI